MAGGHAQDGVGSPGSLSREHGGRGRGSALPCAGAMFTSCVVPVWAAEQEPQSPLRSGVPGPEGRDTGQCPIRDYPDLGSAAGPLSPSFLEALMGPTDTRRT